MSKRFIPIIPANISWQEGVPIATGFDDIYFSLDNGLAESTHVFIEGNHLIERWQAMHHDRSCSHFVIGETGFGSGLNFLLSWFLWLQHAPEHVCLHFISCEQHPLLKDDLKRCLALWPELGEQAEELISQYPSLTPGFHHLQFAHGRVKLTLMFGEALECWEQLLKTGDVRLESQLQSKAVDAWFLDGFSPAKNPTMWTPELLTILGLLSDRSTTLATFSVASVVKQSLKAAGFNCLKKPGFGRKREMLTAQFQNDTVSIKRRNTPWAFSVIDKPCSRQAIILGGGLAGCFMARNLANRGWNVTVLDEEAGPGRGASANEQAVLFPNFSAFSAPMTDFMLLAFQYAVRMYRSILKQQSFGELKGILQLADSKKTKDYFASLNEWMDAYPELGAILSSDEATKIAGVPIASTALYIPQAGWINSRKLCEHLLDHGRINWDGDCHVGQITRNGKAWCVNKFQAEALIVATGYKANHFKETQYLPLKPIRGQMSLIPPTKTSALLKIPVCGNGHVLPVYEGHHHLGATYDLGVNHAECSPMDDKINLNVLNHLPVQGEWNDQIIANWAGVRASTPDYLPVAGSVIQSSMFETLYSGLATNAKRWIPKPAPVYPGLYVLAGFGSRGLTTIPLCTEWLAGVINHEPSILPRRLIEAISPSRFLKKKIERNFVISE
ncbi:bifunctional tRNA (5-methylaminomethyl-2-thiouridine)(34)-methyltransferase MnmD/FAD-dependent 5-carboxymethylaminomethyl-2-thiouridine(34) oxidoreductase MnmC [Legionella yabuuchiae]|uniref:bifunctional tRNA (5-methylaminomethyl-2-thiouridine)(34)-methyltransferase MnmD/FAD-dependent 5-carboxymethylaminomethyl-2-thiouridine(34) oxidoreductase MnmC n=1 Tax=Legionella yabuuchiae TaxID=376727 RepID=UPI001055170E|nr:bifunctional tRNA (5-methylaminomethyl-2-thiouridine)(34)-methyltransferase MnmD/FAD-dependent 5-carboxymethylaminomethyl-2-thiouridine(34) oxidoreductase MnmC [Legionella yabuuchiae]